MVDTYNDYDVSDYTATVTSKSKVSTIKNQVKEEKEIRNYLKSHSSGIMEEKSNESIPVIDISKISGEAEKF